MKLFTNRVIALIIDSLFSTSFLFVIVYALYEAAMVYFAGGTVGKLIMKLEVEKEHGSLSFGDCLIRGVMKAFSLQIWILGVFSAIFAYSDQHSSLHDRIAGTSVWEKL